MLQLFRLLAQMVVIAYGVAAAICLLGCAALSFYVGVWLLRVADGGWFLTGLGLLCGVFGAGFMMSASETFLKAWPPERPDERMRRLESKSLYIPRPRQRDRGRSQSDP